MNAMPSVQLEESRCLSCNASLADDSQRCSNCGYSLTGLQFYNPKHFIWLAVLFSAMVPIYLSASNWGKIGKTRAKRLWLGVGFFGYVLLFTILVLLPDLGAGGKLIGYAINWPIAYKLRDMQGPVYRAALRLGAQTGSLFKGTILGLGLLLCALAVPLGGLVAKSEIESRQAARLFEQGKYAEAATIFEKALRQDPDDDSAVFKLAVCHAAMERWAEAAQGFEKYLRRNDKVPAAFALLSHVRSAQGRQPEADSLASRARALDPNIFKELFPE